MFEIHSTYLNVLALVLLRFGAVVYICSSERPRFGYSELEFESANPFQIPISGRVHSTA